MQNGTVKFYNDSKGYGFITDDQTGDEIFVHATGLAGGKIKQGDNVTYELSEGKKGINAIKVRKV